MNLPFVSILLPIKNEAAHIEKCLQRIADQTYPKEKLELLIIDGMSQDATRNLIEQFKKKSPSLVVRVLDDTKNQRSAALNLGIHEAKGDIILRLDGRSVIPNHYIDSCVKTLLETGADNVGGIQKALPANTLTQQAIGYAMSHRFGVGDAKFRLGTQSGDVESVYLGCFKRDIFQKVGCFDEEAVVITEDSEMNYRIRKAGGKVYLNKDIEVGYLPRNTFADLARLYFRYGGARAGFLIKWKTLTGWRQFLPPIFLAFLVLFPLLSFFSPVFFLTWIFLLVMYSMADILASLDVCLTQQNKAVFWKMLWVFPVMHFSWAFGFWRRLLQRPKRGEYWGF